MRAPSKKKKFGLIGTIASLAISSLCLGIIALPQINAVAEGSGDAKYHAPVGVVSAGWAWDDVLSVCDNADGSTHVAFTKTSYVTIRTTSEKAYALDGLHLKFANFTGDGMGIAFSSSASPDAWDKAIRLFPCNVEDNPYMRASFPDWGGLQVLGALETFPMRSDFEITVDKVTSGWNFVFDGQTFHFSDEQVAEAIPDTEHVYISFAGMGGSEYINTFSFDYISAHGGDVRCADTLTAAEKTAIQDVETLIDNIGDVSYTTVSAARIDLAAQAYVNLNEDLKPMISNLQTLVYAQQNYYALGNPVTFNENNIISNFYVASDNHLDTNDCTTFADGSPQDRFNLFLDYVSATNADAVILTGDMTDWARFDNDAGLPKAHKQIGMLKDSLDGHLANDKALFFTMGNHDSSESPGESRVALFNEILGDAYYASDINKAEAEWVKGYRHAKIAGFDYLSVEWNFADENQNISDEAIAWLGEKLAQITSASDYDGKPIFLVSHVPFNNTVDGSNAGAETLSKQKLFNVLKGYPQLVMLSGHSHDPIGTEKFIHQDSFTHIGASTTAYIGMSAPNFLEDGGYFLGTSSYRPKDMLVAHGLHIEIDNEYNMRVTRVDYRKDGQPIWNVIIVPAPDLDNKTHLNYYTDARASRVAMPVYDADAEIEAKLISATELEITFDTLLSEGVVQSYEIEIVNETTSLTYGSFQATWRYINEDLVPDKKTVVISNFTMEKPFTINIRAVDTFKNKSNALQYLMSDSIEEDKAKAAEIDAMIENVGQITEYNDKIQAAMDAYNKLSYDQKEWVVNTELLFALYEQYDNLFETLEEYEYGVKIESTVLGPNYWLNGMMDFHNDEKGIVIKYIDGVPNVRMGVKAFDLDGLHITFDSLVKEENMVADPSIGIILGGTAHPQYTEPEKTGILLFFDTNIGKIEAHPGGQVICRGEELKYRNLKDKQFDIRFTALEDGGYKVECAGLVGKLDASYFDGSFSLKDTRRTYISLSNWVNEAYFSYRLLAIHDKKTSCAGYEEVTASIMQTVADTVTAINEIGNVSLQSESKITAAETLYASLPEYVTKYVTNYDALQAARTLFDRLNALQKPDSSNSGSSGNGSSISGSSGGNSGCNGSMSLGFFPMALLGLAIIKKFKKGD